MTTPKDPQASEGAFQKFEEKSFVHYLEGKLG